MRLVASLIVKGTLAFYLVATIQPVSGEEFADMVKRVPGSANALIMVDAKALFNSPIARSEGWEGSREKQFAAGLTSLPPHAGKLMLAANIDVELMHPTWEVAIAEMEAKTVINSLASRVAGVVDSIANSPAVRLPDDSFVVQFSDGTLGTMSP